MATIRIKLSESVSGADYDYPAGLETDAQKFKQRFQTMLKDQIDILDSELN